MSKIILLNGPAGCGKNVAVDHLKTLYPLVDRRCKDHLFTLTQQLFNISPEDFFKIYTNRNLKEIPLPEFEVSEEAANLLSIMLDKQVDQQLSIREAMIFVSENICKPSFGEDYFGQHRANSIRDDELAIDDSCGFEEEIAPTIEKLGEDNVLLVRIRGRGNFDGDSRNFIPDGCVSNTVDIYNNKSEDQYLREIGEVAQGFYG